MARDVGPIGSWSLAGDGRDGSGQGRHAVVRGDVRFGASADPAFGRPCATLTGAGRLEVTAPDDLGVGDLTVAAWVNAAAAPTTVLGDIVSWFDARARRGFNLALEHGTPCGSHGNDRTAWFGIDAETAPVLTDHGRPGDATVMVCSLAAHDGSLYAATWEQGPTPRGRVYRFSGNTWIDCGSPWDANAVTRLAVHEGALYAGVSRLRGGGSGLEDSANQNPGGRVLRFEGGQAWSDMGQVDDADAIAALITYAGSLYAAPMYSEGVFRFDGPGRWTSCGSPGRRLLALGVHGGAMYGAGNDHADPDGAIALTKAGVVVPARSQTGGGGVFRYDGDDRWVSCGLQPDTTQLYSIETYGDRMHIGTWPTGLVFRGSELDRDGDATWRPVGRLGDETEIMNLQAHNGKLYGGTLPHAQIFRYDDDDDWALVATLDETPDVRYRRAASMVVFGGELWVGTLPSGHVHSMRAGAVASADGSLTPGWHHLAGVRRGPAVELFVDGHRIATASVTPDVASIASTAETPLLIGGGPRAGFEGELAEVRLWDRALDPRELGALAAEQ